MRIYFLRHGESEANVAGVISDDPAKEYALTPMGVAQAELAAEDLSEVPFTRIYVSEHRRARETAEVLVNSWLDLAQEVAEEVKEKDEDAAAKTDSSAASGNGDKYPISEDARLNERHSNMDGQPVANFNNLVKPDPVNIRPEGGESFREQMERLQAFMDEVASRHVDGTVLAVSHENPILAAQAVAGRSPEEAARGEVANCAWVKIEWPPVEKSSNNGGHGKIANNGDVKDKSG